MDAYTIIVMIFGLLILTILILLYFYNRIKIKENEVLKQYNHVKKYILEERNNILEMVKFIKETFEDEGAYAKELTASVEILDHLSNKDGNLKKLKKVQSTNQYFFDLEKVYPKLKKNKDYLTLKEKATTIRERMIYSFDDYNKKVREYNAMDEIEIYSRIKKIARFPKYDCYK